MPMVAKVWLKEVLVLMPKGVPDTYPFGTLKFPTPKPKGVSEPKNRTGSPVPIVEPKGVVLFAQHMPPVPKLVGPVAPL